MRCGVGFWRSSSEKGTLSSCIHSTISEFFRFGKTNCEDVILNTVCERSLIESLFLSSVLWGCSPGALFTREVREQGKQIPDRQASDFGGGHPNPTAYGHGT